MPTYPYLLHPPARIALVQLIKKPGFLADRAPGVLRTGGADSVGRGLGGFSSSAPSC